MAGAAEQPGGVVSFRRRGAYSRLNVSFQRKGLKVSGGLRRLSGEMKIAAERKTSLGKDWHSACLRCEKCNKTLTPGSHAEHEGKPYCHNPCYSALYGPGEKSRMEKATMTRTI
ncbi:Uncharacterized protein GBIM_03676 [Gryllus bimaculatus]|nr:Uncharacterized protein GBIM_03676 [Gryllus bimaculatus]